ncbi:MAG: hypothetical protein FJX57_09040 [Alphaproteobacteria bacterium]|nr:hypothetical protein [Alphaproteobacteria bacterium]
MTPLPVTAELEAVARRVVWFKAPTDALANPRHFIALVLTYGTHEDCVVLRRYIDDETLREAVWNAPPGIFDARSWAYWNLKTGRFPPPPLPSRGLE